MILVDSIVSFDLGSGFSTVLVVSFVNLELGVLTSLDIFSSCYVNVSMRLRNRDETKDNDKSMLYKNCSF